MNRNKRNRHKLCDPCLNMGKLGNPCTRSGNSKVGEMIYLMPQVNFILNFKQPNDRDYLSEIHGMTSKIVKIVTN